MNELRRKVLALLSSNLPREVLVEVLLDVIVRALKRAGGRPSRLDEDEPSSPQTSIKFDVSPATGKTSNSTDLVLDSGSDLTLPDSEPSSPISEIVEFNEREPAGFLEFWGLFPKKVGKAEARRSWIRKRPPIGKVRAALAWQVRSRQWIDGYIPNPATYLNQGRWDDEPQAAAKAPVAERTSRQLSAIEAFAKGAPK